MHIYSEVIKTIHGKPTLADVTVLLTQIQTMRPEAMAVQDPGVRLLVQKLTQMVDISEMTLEEYGELSEWCLDQIPRDPRQQFPDFSFIEWQNDYHDEEGVVAQLVRAMELFSSDCDGKVNWRKTGFLVSVQDAFVLLRTLYMGRLGKLANDQAKLMQAINERQDEVALRHLFADPSTTMCGLRVFVDVTRAPSNVIPLKRNSTPMITMSDVDDLERYHNEEDARND